MDNEAGFAIHNADDVEEVTNYLRAFRLVQNNLRDPKGLPISTRLLCEAHRLLLSGVRPGNAVFVPPPAESVAELLGQVEQFIHAPASPLPPLVKIALVHAQFETIQPFLNGNGRIGRLLIAALLEHWGLLAQPLMYLSGYLKQLQAEYNRRRPQATAGRPQSRACQLSPV